MHNSEAKSKKDEFASYFYLCVCSRQKSLFIQCITLKIDTLESEISVYFV